MGKDSSTDEDKDSSTDEDHGDEGGACSHSYLMHMYVLLCIDYSETPLASLVMPCLATSHHSTKRIYIHSIYHIPLLLLRTVGATLPRPRFPHV